MKEKLSIGITDIEKVAEIAHALSSPVRLKILSLIEEKPLNISKIADELQMPLSSTALAIRELEKSGLVITTSKPGVRGSQKLCGLKVDSLFIQIKDQEISSSEDIYVEQMPIGNYSDFRIVAPCGILSKDGFITPEDSPQGFFMPEHVNAQLIWFTKGYLEYRFFNRFLRRAKFPQSIEFSFEMCSEAPGYNSEWRSDISVWLNQKRIGTLISLGDYGNRRGRLNPVWWSSNNTQYGFLHRICITSEGTLLDDYLNPSFTLSDLSFVEDDYISLKLGVEDNAKYIGGMNLFGEQFGDYPQSIVMRAVF